MQSSKILIYLLALFISRDVSASKSTRWDAVHRLPCFVTLSRVSGNWTKTVVPVCKLFSLACSQIGGPSSAKLGETALYQITSPCPCYRPDGLLSQSFLTISLHLPHLPGQYLFLYRQFSSCTTRLKCSSGESAHDEYIHIYRILLLSTFSHCVKQYNKQNLKKGINCYGLRLSSSLKKYQFHFLQRRAFIRKL